MVSSLKAKVTELVLNAGTARLGQAMRETQDQLVRDELEATASVINSVGGVNGDLPTEMAVSDIDSVVALLQTNNGEYITNMIGAENKFSTSPLGDSYGMLSSTRMIPVFNNMQGFVRKFQYPNSTNVLSCEWGGVNNVRTFVSSAGSVSANASLLGNDVANNFICAKEAYKVVTQVGGKGKVIYRPPGLNEHAQYKSSLIDLELLAA